MQLQEQLKAYLSLPTPVPKTEGEKKLFKNVKVAIESILPKI